MVDLFIESGHASINKHDETLCGDSYSIKKNGEQLVAVLSDGLGSGVKANILSTLTANMLSTMMLNRLPIDECIETVAIRKLSFAAHGQRKKACVFNVHSRLLYGFHRAPCAVR